MNVYNPKSYKKSQLIDTSQLPYSIIFFFMGVPPSGANNHQRNGVGLSAISLALGQEDAASIPNATLSYWLYRIL